MFGHSRTVCDCSNCVRCCESIPGYLIPNDLAHMIPDGDDPLKWAEENLRASPGAKLMNRATGEQYRVKTLVPANKPDGSCKFLTEDKKCSIHEKSPFGCAYFDSHMSRLVADPLSMKGIQSIQFSALSGLYFRIWNHLSGKGLVTASPDEKRAKMGDERR